MSATAQFHSAMADLLGRSHLVRASDLASMVSEVMRRCRIEINIYLVDFEQRSLRLMPPPSAPAPQPLPIEGTLAGRAFTTVRTHLAAGDPYRLWVPILDGTERLGVLEVRLPDDLPGDDEAVHDGCGLVAGLLGHLIQSKLVYGDALHAVRRSQPMTPASELLWQLLPPLTFACRDMVISALVEPCYDIGGDGFDYAVDYSLARVAVFDAVARGLRASLPCAAALAATRAARRDGADLSGMAAAADAALVEQWDDSRFVTAVLGEIDLNTGRFRYLNAGHPPPVLLRGGRAVRVLDGGRRRPLGLDDASATALGDEPMEPGDRLFLYTDGVTEARSPEGEFFGLERLIDLTERHSNSRLPTAEILRRISHAVIDHQGGRIADDATLLLVEWSPDAALRALTSGPPSAIADITGAG